MDTELARLVAKTRGVHAAVAPTVGHRAPQDTTAVPALSRKRKTIDGTKEPKPKHRSVPKPSSERLPPPSFAERDHFMSASASRIHTAQPVQNRSFSGESRRPHDEEQQQQRIEFKSMALSVEMLGAAKLSGLSKKDQKARERERLGLAPQKDHKRPYKELMALRKKQRDQDADAAALSKQAGMTARKQTAELAGSGKGGNAKRGPTDGVALGGNGVLHVDQKLIRNVRFHAAKGKGSGTGGKGGKGGKGKGGGKGGGKGAGKGSKGRGGKGKGR